MSTSKKLARRDERGRKEAAPRKIVADRRDVEFLKVTAHETVAYVRASLGLALAIRDLHALQLAECERRLVFVGQQEVSDEAALKYRALTERANDLRGTVALAAAMARQLTTAESGFRLAVRAADRVCAQ